jgi:N6-L-threonylcarbamoyladenine synthase
MALIVSGGHTELVRSRRRDYTARPHPRRRGGEAFDKVAKLTSLPYPGARDRSARRGGTGRATSSRARLEPGTLDFSFSGVKTAVRYALRDDPSLGARELGSPRELPRGGRRPLALNARRALDRSAKRIAVCGGVAANTRLREAFREMAEESGAELLLAPVEYCTDNAAMVASAGDALFRRGRCAPPDQSASADLPLPFKD